MRFSSLISALQQGQAGLKHHELADDPELNGAASLEQAGADQLSFLEKGNALTAALSESGVGAVLLPDQADLPDELEMGGATAGPNPPSTRAGG